MRVEPQRVGGAGPGPSVSFWWWSSEVHKLESSLILRGFPLRGRCWCSRLQSRRAQRASLRIAVYTAERHLALDISKFPSWNSQISITLKLRMFQGCQAMTDSSLFCSPLWPGNRSPWYGQCSSVLAVQEFLLQSRNASLPNSLHKGQGLMAIFEIICEEGRVHHHTITHNSVVCWFCNFIWLIVFFLCVWCFGVLVLVFFLNNAVAILSKNKMEIGYKTTLKQG